ncbi:MAG: RNA methyltransferase [Geminicoccaceae bacterium]
MPRHHPRQQARQGHRPATPTGRILLYGQHAVTAGLANPDRPLVRLWATEEALARLDTRRTVPTEKVQGSALVRHVGDAPHQGLVLEVGPLPPRSLADIDPGPDRPALVLALDRVTDPRNLGAILRTAAATGVAGVILPGRHSAELNGACAKAASGALDLVPIVEAGNLARSLAELKQRNFWLCGLDGDAPDVLETLDLPPRLVLVLGSEGEGMRRLVAESCDYRARLAIEGVESLNVAVAAGIALYVTARKLKPT